MACKRHSEQIWLIESRLIEETIGLKELKRQVNRESVDVGKGCFLICLTF
jgi:hypothetical protein